MGSRRLLDTNVVSRFLMGDSENRAKLAGRLLAASDAGELTLVMLPEVLVECVCVLESFYEHPREHIARVFGELVRSVGVELGGLEVHLDALASYGRTKVHYVDCVIAATAWGEWLAGGDV